MDDISSHYGNDNNQISAILPFFIIREKENELPVYNPCPYICQNLLSSVVWTCGKTSFYIFALFESEVQSLLQVWPLHNSYLLYLRVKSSLCFRSGPCIILGANLGGNYQDEVVETHLLVWYSVAMTPKLSPVCSHHTHCPSPTSSPPRIYLENETQPECYLSPPFTFLLQKSSKS